jgi:hypothetical protein
LANASARRHARHRSSSWPLDGARVDERSAADAAVVDVVAAASPANCSRCGLSPDLCALSYL